MSQRLMTTFDDYGRQLLYDILNDSRRDGKTGSFTLQASDGRLNSKCVTCFLVLIWFVSEDACSIVAVPERIFVCMVVLRERALWNSGH